jgi:hypothetical protein
VVRSSPHPDFGPYALDHRNGIFCRIVIQVPGPVTDFSGGDSGDEGVGLHIFGDDGSGGNNGPLSEGHAGQEDAARAEPGIIADDHRLELGFKVRVAVVVLEMGSVRYFNIIFHRVIQVGKGRL